MPEPAYQFFVFLEKYTRGVSAVESILTLDRLRQSVAVKELLQARGQPLMRKTASVPNFSQVSLIVLVSIFIITLGVYAIRCWRQIMGYVAI